MFWIKIGSELAPSMSKPELDALKASNSNPVKRGKIVIITNTGKKSISISRGDGTWVDTIIPKSILDLSDEDIDSWIEEAFE